MIAVILTAPPHTVHLSTAYSKHSKRGAKVLREPSDLSISINPRYHLCWHIFPAPPGCSLAPAEGCTHCPSVQLRHRALHWCSCKQFWLCGQRYLAPWVLQLRNSPWQRKKVTPLKNMALPTRVYWTENSSYSATVTASSIRLEGTQEENRGSANHHHFRGSQAHTHPPPTSTQSHQ